jgi:small subunit ribosomal protein S2
VAPRPTGCLRDLSISSRVLNTTAEPQAPTESVATDDGPLLQMNSNTPLTKILQLTKVSGAKKIRSDAPAIVHNYEASRQLKQWTSGLGSTVERRYSPNTTVTIPPKPQDITLELLMASQTHMGHHTSLWNPANSRYIYGVRAGIHIISLETTAAHLRRAGRVVEEVAYRGGLILFVGNRKGQMPIVTRAAQLAKACHLFTKWTPGAITNRDIILEGKEIRIVDENDRPLEGFESFDGRPLLPDLVVCLNPLENYTLLYECGLKSIPTIGIIDTNADPSWVTYTIPANDDRLVSTIPYCFKAPGDSLV